MRRGGAGGGSNVDPVHGIDAANTLKWRRCGGCAAQEIAEAEARGEELVPLESEPTLEEQMQTGVARLRTDRGTWKVPPACERGRGAGSDGTCPVRRLRDEAHHPPASTMERRMVTQADSREAGAGGEIACRV